MLTQQNRLLFPLPKLLMELRSVIGHNAMARLAIAYGGTDVYIPALLPADEDHWLIATIGSTAAQKLVEHYSISRSSSVARYDPRYGRGCLLKIPKGPKELRIEPLIAAGLSGPEIARKLGIHERTVRLHKQQMREAFPDADA